MDERRFEIEPRNKFVTANRSIVEYEIRSGIKVSFLHLVDLSQVEVVRERATLSGAVKPSYTAFVARAVALALRDFPYANSRICRPPGFPFGTRRQRFSEANIAIACERVIENAECVSFVDILRNADEQTLAQCTEWLRKLNNADVENNQQWREFSTLISRLPNWLSKYLIRLPIYSPKLWVKYRGGAVLISSPGKYGIDGILGAWPWPIGISFGVVKERPVIKDGAVVACRSFFLTLSFDRRVMAGAAAGRFFAKIVEYLEHADANLTD